MHIPDDKILMPKFESKTKHFLDLKVFLQKYNQIAKDDKNRIAQFEPENNALAYHICKEIKEPVLQVDFYSKNAVEEALDTAASHFSTRA